jgi:hypothetical protein
VVNEKRHVLSSGFEQCDSNDCHPHYSPLTERKSICTYSNLNPYYSQKWITEFCNCFFYMIAILTISIVVLNYEGTSKLTWTSHFYKKKKYIYIYMPDSPNSQFSLRYSFLILTLFPIIQASYWCQTLAHKGCHLTSEEFLLVSPSWGIWGCSALLWAPLWTSGQSSWLQIERSQVRYLAIPDFLRNSGSGTGST